MSIHVIASCTSRKRVSIAPRRRLRAFRRSDTTSLISTWEEALLDGPDHQIAARDVYAGEHWVEFMRVVDSRPKGARVVGWVASAGYGLIPLDAEITGYAATFSPGSADSVAGLGFTTVAWWDALSGLRGPCSDSARSVTEIVQQAASTDLVVVTASPTYLRAMSNDLQTACEAAVQGGTADLLVMGSKVPSVLHQGFPNHVVQFDSGLQRLVGGSRIALNIRVLAKALEAGALSRARIQEWITEAGAQHPALPQSERERADDEEVAEFIAQRLRENFRLKASSLLREWRDGGRACEQGRFRRIYDRVVRQPSIQRSLELESSPE